MFVAMSNKCLLAGALLLAVAGCCPTTNNRPSASGPSAGGRAFSQVNGELVYNLGQGVVANSEAVVLAGGFAKPRAARLPGGVAGCCPNPLPQAYLDAVRDNRPLNVKSTPSNPTAPAASTAAAPVAGGALAWEPGVLSAAGYCAPTVCPVLPEAQGLCNPGDNLSECFTLTEDEAAATQIYVPTADAPLNAERGALARIETAGRDDALAPPRNLTEPAPAAPAAPAAAPSRPAAPAQRGNSGDIMPPVPDAADFDAAIDAILTRDGETNASASAPAVQLPPKLQ